VVGNAKRCFDPLEAERVRRASPAAGTIARTAHSAAPTEARRMRRADERLLNTLTLDCVSFALV
jgi:hypothetical protein